MDKKNTDTLERDHEESIKVSVCVITYNQASYVRRTIDSILSQKVDFPIEILIADDASTDGTQKILKDYKRKNPNDIRIILRKKNLGATKNVYQLLSSARGEYICGLEGDDYWIDESFIQNQIAFLDNHPFYIASCGRCVVVDKNGKVFSDLSSIGNRNFWSFDKREYSIGDFCEWKMPGHMSAVIYRNIYKEDGFDGSVLYKFHPMIGDRTTLLHLVVRGKIYCYDRPVMFYRYVDDTTAKNWMAVSNKNNKRFEEYKLICTLEKYAKRRYYSNFNMSKLKKDKIAAAIAVCIINKSLSDFFVAMRIITYDKKVIKNTIVALSAALQKCYWLMRGKPDHRVVV